MTRSQFDDEAATHPKLAIAEASVGDAAWTMWSKAIIYCNRHLTDGFVPTAVLATLTKHKAPKRVAEALVTARLSADGAGLFEAVDGGYRVHDFLERSPSRAKVLAARAADVARKRPGGASDSGQIPTGIQDGSQPNPDPRMRTRASPGVGSGSLGSGSGSGPEGVQGERRPMSPDAEAILGAIRMHKVFDRLFDAAAIADDLAGKCATSGKPLPWVIAAVGRAADEIIGRDAGGGEIAPAEVGKVLVRNGSDPFEPKAPRAPSGRPATPRQTWERPR